MERREILEAVLVRPDRRDEPARFGGRTLAGVPVRIGQRLPALAIAVWFNCQLGAEHKRSLVAYDH